MKLYDEDGHVTDQNLSNIALEYLEIASECSTEQARSRIASRLRDIVNQIIARRTLEIAFHLHDSNMPEAMHCALRAPTVSPGES